MNLILNYLNVNITLWILNRTFFFSVGENNALRKIPLQVQNVTQKGVRAFLAGSVAFSAGWALSGQLAASGRRMQLQLGMLHFDRPPPAPVSALTISLLPWLDYAVNAFHCCRRGWPYTALSLRSSPGQMVLLRATGERLKMILLSKILTKIWWEEKWPNERIQIGL